MSWFHTAIVINQIATNAQLAVANARIGSLLDNYAADRDEQSRAAHARELVFQLREYLEMVGRESDARFGYFQLLSFQQALITAGISPNSFTAFDEKEYARAVFQGMHNTFVEIEENLGAETVQRLQYLHRLNLAVPHYAELANWEEIKGQFPDAPFLARFLPRGPWLILSFIFPIHLYLIPYVFFGRNVADQVTILLWLVQLALVLSVFGLHKIKKRAALPKIKAMAARFGGWATDAVSEDTCEQIIQQQKGFLTQLGFDIPTNNPSEVYRQRLKELEEMIRSVNFPLTLKYS